MVTLICGKICSGKTTEARKIGGVRLSCDDLMLTLLPEYLGENHAKQLMRVKSYLAAMAAEISKNGADVVLDWGFWSKQERVKTREFFRRCGVETKLLYLEISDEEQKRRVAARNAESDGKHYNLDEATLALLNGKFEAPAPAELVV